MLLVLKQYRKGIPEERPNHIYNVSCRPSPQGPNHLAGKKGSTQSFPIENVR